MIWNLPLLHQDDTRKPRYLPVLPFQPETPDSARGSYLCHLCSTANAGPARPPDLSCAGQSHSDSSDLWVVVALPSSQNVSTHLQWISVRNQEWINSLKFCLIPNVKAESLSVSVTALAMSPMLMLITVLFLAGCRQGMYFNRMNPVNSLKFCTLFFHPLFSTQHKSASQVIADRLYFLHKVSWVKNNIVIYLIFTPCFVTDNLPHRLFETVANYTNIHFCVYVGEIA